jgi:hypothetical protein
VWSLPLVAANYLWRRVTSPHFIDTCVGVHRSTDVTVSKLETSTSSGANGIVAALTFVINQFEHSQPSTCFKKISTDIANIFFGHTGRSVKGKNCLRPLEWSWARIPHETCIS